MSGANKYGIVPTMLGTELQSGTNQVRLTFEDEDGAPHRFLLTQPMLLSLIGSLTKLIEREPLAPVSLSRMRPDQPIDVQGTSVKLLPDNALRITLYAEVEGRNVTIPFELDPAGTVELVTQIAGAGAGSR